MAQVMMPQGGRKNKGMKEIFTLGGALAGGALGSAAGPGGTMAGASLGSSIGGAMGDLANNEQNQAQQIPAPQQSSALMRRQKQMETDNLAALQQAETAASALPEHMRQRYLPPLVQARMLEQQQRGLA